MDDLTSEVTDDSTDDLTNDLTRAQHISDLIVNCCQMNSARNSMNELAFVTAFGYDIDSCSIPDITGSCAELYIDPGDTCIGDVDLMFPRKDQIVVCDGSIVDSIDVDETVEVAKIETSDCPNGYVHLRLLGELQFNWETEQFEYRVSNNTGEYLRLSFTDHDTDLLHGPARVKENRLYVSSNVDIVPAIRLIVWPSLAQSWISRHRHHSWPSNAVVSEVQRNGCDLVYVSHRDYKHDSNQWRYSFSRAEVTLIRSWTPIQQLVYHMLRYFAKQTIIREWKDDDKVICTYHIKTLMLWACERKSPVWWESNCVIVLCSILLGTMMKWIGEKMCPHYFIPEWNLFDYTMKESRLFETIELLNIHTNIHALSEWFRINYLSKVFHNKNKLISQNNWEYQQVLDVVAASYRSIKKCQTSLQEWVVERHFEQSYSYDNAIAMNFRPTHWNATKLCMLIYSKNLAPDLHILNLAVASLHLAWNISGIKESDLSNHELLDVLSEVVLKLSGHDTWNRSTPYNILSFKECSKWYFIKGVRLLSIHCKEHSAAYCLRVKTCKRYFKSALSIKDEYSESIHDACHVYLSALYYVSGANQEKTTKHILKAENGTSTEGFLKPQILSYSSLRFVDTAAHVCGFCFLFDQVLKNQNKSTENGFTLSAAVQCMILSVSRINNTNPSNKLDRKEMTKHNFTSLFDICLWAVSVHEYRRTTQTANREIHKRSSKITNNLSSDEGDIQFCLEDLLEETLVKISVDMFTKYYDMQFTTMPHIGIQYRCRIVSHYKALYYYRTGEYVKLLNTCDSIIYKEIFLSYLEDRKHPKFLPGCRVQDVFSVPVLFAYQTLFGNDVICLTGLIELTRSVLDEESVDESKAFYDEREYQGKVKGCQPQYLVTRISCLFLVYFLRFQSLVQLHFQKRDILSALDDLKHASAGFVFEDILMLFVVKTLKRLLR